MKILKIIHGYPPHYNAGSEVYSQLLCLGLARKNHAVHVFTREDNPFIADFSVRLTQDELDPRITLHLINVPMEKHHYRFSQPKVDAELAHLLNTEMPDIVHIGHLNHLSTSLIYTIVQHHIPIVFTLHDFWLMCPRGQFIQRNSIYPDDRWALCGGQENRKCAEKCYAGYFTGIVQQQEQDIKYWTDWVGRRMQHVRDIASHVNLFIAPSQYLYQRFIDDFDLPENKMMYLDYGFARERLQGRQRQSRECFTFGYIGTHIPAKGIQQLITAFSQLEGNCVLKLWGRDRGANTAGLRALIAQLPAAIQQRITWLPEYRNEHIVEEVFNHVDCIVVPSIWCENSPLVIHEALQARVPVITANHGGMADYVHHEVNGLLFEHRNSTSLAQQMQRLLQDPEFANRIGQRGYLQSADGNIPAIDTHVDALMNIYQQLINTDRRTACLNP